MKTGKPSRVGKLRDNLILALLALTALGVGIFMWRTGYSSGIETIAFVSGVVAVWLTAKEHIWNWPIGLVNVALTFYVLYNNRLWSDTVLQVIYFVLGVFGWYWWLHGSEQRKEIHIGGTPRKEWGPVLGIALVAVGIWTYINVRLIGAAPFFDASLTVLSLVAQYMLTRKYIQSWHFWILVDIFYVPLFLWKGLYLFAILYLIFTWIAFFGLKEWRRLQAVRETGNKEANAPLPAAKLVHGMLAAGILMGVFMTWAAVQFERGMPKEHFAMFRGFGEIKAKAQVFDWETDKPFGPPSELSHVEIVHLQANALDPLLYRPAVQSSSDDNRDGSAYDYQTRRGQLIFEQEGLEPLVYDVFVDYHIELGGKPISSNMWKEQFEDFGLMKE